MVNLGSFPPTVRRHPQPNRFFHRLFPRFCCGRLSGAVYLKTLTLKGFKSFAESTTLDLEPGITVVVGPNGSGKSNIVDAVAWVLGAQGAKTIRSNKMEDVIFAGTSKKAALGRAEVSLTIDNASGTLPIEFSEVTITRTLFRTGESEYAINGVSCRLLDIQELLSDSGVGRQQHVIVSQGQLAAILDSRPEDRRSVIEEAAGILKYRKRRERAQRRLESTEANFVRLGDLLRELRRQLRPLERQADAARKHVTMAEELRALRIYVSGRELAGLKVRSETQARVHSDLQKRERDIREELARLDADVMLAESQLSALGGGAALAEGDLVNDPYAGADLGDVLARAEALYEKARGQLAFLGERRRSVERDRNAFLDSGVVESLSAEAAKIGTELNQVEDEANLLPPEFEELIRQESLLETERNSFNAEWGADTSAVVSADGSGTARSAGQVRSELHATQQSLDRGRSDDNRLTNRRTQLAERLGRLESDATRVAGEVAELVALVGLIEGAVDSGAASSPIVSTLTAARESAETSDTAAEAAVRSSEETLRSADGERRAWQARVDALVAALDEARARAGAQRLAGLDGVVGTLLDLVEVDAGWEAAFEAALGEAIASVVVTDSDVARKALARLQESSVSGAVLALGSFGTTSGPIATVSGGTPIRSHVRSTDARVGKALDTLLSNAFCVEGEWTAALDAALVSPDAIIVTRNGDRFSSVGWRAGVGSAGATGAALDEAREAATKATEEATAATTALSEARRTLEQSRGALKSARQAEQQAITEHQQRVNRLNTARNAVARFGTDSTDVGNEIAIIEREQAELRTRITADEQRIAVLNEELPGLVEAENALAARQARRREASQRLDQRASAASALRRELEVRVAGIEERRRILTRRSDEIDERLSRSVTERSQAEVRRVELELIMERTETLHAIVLEHAERLEEGLADIRDRRKRQNEAARAATFRLDGLRKGRAENENQLRLILERIQRAEIEQAEIRLRIETLVEQIRREFDLEPDKTTEAECPPLVDGTAPTTRIRDLERELRLMGPINPLALEEFEALQERHKLIESELEDVKTARRDLAKVIKAIDEEIITVFGAAYADVAENFQKLFEMLFPGGSGSLRLTDADDPLNCGVEVEARPSGKNVRKLSLLSGGERSLTALAFLFAVFRSRPSPFYLMDEVEAALDDVNLHRFLTLLEEFRREAQLLVVSHQKKTMEAADSLYGVTMQPGGSSRVVSERVSARS
jgi:chromosome segregation protein